MQIFQHEEQRARCGEFREAAKERFEETNAFALGVQARNIRKRDARVDFRQECGETRERHARLQRSNERKRRTQRVGEALVWNGFGRAGRAQQRPAAAIFDRVRKLERDSGLSDARLTADECARAATTSDATPRFKQPFHLVAASDEGQNCRSGARRSLLVAVFVGGGFAARDPLRDRGGFGHWAGAHFGPKPLDEGGVLAERAGAVAAFVAHRDDAPHHVLAPGIHGEHSAGGFDGEREIGISPGLGNAFGQATQVRVAVALADRVEPFVVDLRQQVAPIQVDRFAEAAPIVRGRGKCVHVEPHVGVGVPREFLGIDVDVAVCRLGQASLHILQRGAQLRSRSAFFVVGVEQKGEILARYRGGAVQQEVGEDLQRLSRRRKAKRLALDRDLQVTQQANIEIPARSNDDLSHRERAFSGPRAASPPPRVLVRPTRYDEVPNTPKPRR